MKIARQVIRGIRVFGVYEEPLMTRRQATRFERSLRLHMKRCFSLGRSREDSETLAYHQAWIETFGRDL